MEEALQQVVGLEEFSQADDQVALEAPSAMALPTFPEVNYADVNAYANERFAYHNEELRMIARLEQTLRDGDPFLSFLYSYRSVSRAIPQVADTDTVNKGEIYEKTLEVLQPQVLKMKQLMAFCDSAVETIVDVVRVLTESRKKEKNFPSEDFLYTLAKSFNMMIVMDAIKNAKTSLNNDNSMYKRALSNVKKTTQSGKDETTENQKLYMFLATRDQITNELKKAMQTGVKENDTLEDLVEMCAFLLENKYYVYPDTKHVLLKAMAFGIVLIDREPLDKNSLLKNKKAMDKFTKIIKSTPVVPLFGDMSIPLESIFKSKEPGRWGYDASDEGLKRSYSILAALPEVRENYKNFLADFGIVSNEAHHSKSESGDISSNRLCKQIYDILQRGCILAGDISRRILEQSAWKFDKPTDPYTNSECPQTASDYEKVVRYNYNGAEKNALIEMVSMVKSLHRMLFSVDAEYGDAVRKYVHHDVQKFIHVTLSDIISHVSKKKKPSVNLLLHVKEIGGDFLESYDPAAAAATKKKSKKGKLGAEPSSTDLEPFPSRNAGVSSSQLTYMRCLLDAAFNEKAPGMKGGFMKDTDFSNSEVSELSAFHRASFFYPYVLNYTETLNQCCDLSELWYKEFYLEISKEIQFPIEMSLPWILTDHILTTETPELTESIFYPLDLYNDAANRALHKLQTRFLYDEIEAELNLAFDQFVFKLSQNVFAHYKTLASSVMMNKGFKSLLEEGNLMDAKFDPPKNRYQNILKQRHFMLLGRSIDMGQVLAQRMVQYIKKSLETAIVRFEGSELPSILELHTLVEHNKLTFRLLSDHMSLGCGFEEIFDEVNEEASLLCGGGRIMAHTISEIVQDVAPNFCYNAVTSRFVRTPFSLTDPVHRSHVPRSQPIYLFGAKHFTAAFNSIFELNKNYIGETHVKALLELVGRKGLPILIGELSKNLELLFKQLLSPYVEALARGFPPSTKLPLFLYKINGTYEYFYAKLKPLLTYRDLKTEVFQAFREFGNTFCFVSMLDQIIASNSVLETPLSAPFLGLASVDSDLPQEELFTLKQVMLESREFLAGSGTSVDFVKFGETADAISRPGSAPHSLLKILLREFETIFSSVREEWRGSHPTNDVIEVDYCVEFYRIWSAIQFAICTPPLNASEFSSRDLFGEGLAWAGCIMIYLLDQVERFNIFDFSYHMANVASLEKEALPQISGVDLGRFADLANFYKTVNDDIFDILRLVGGHKDKKVGEFSPPTSSGDEGGYIPAAHEHGTAKRIVTEKKLIPGQI